MIDRYSLEYNENNLEKKYRNSRLRKNDQHSKFYFLIFFIFSVIIFFDDIFRENEESRSTISLAVLLAIIISAILIHNPKKKSQYYYSPLVLFLAILCSKIVADHLTQKPHIVYLTLFLPLFFSWNYSMNFIWVFCMNAILFGSSTYLYSLFYYHKNNIILV